MRRFVRTPLVWLVAALATGAAVLLISGGGGSDEGPPPTGPAAAPAAGGHPPGGAKPRAQRKLGHPGGTRAAVNQAVRQSPRARLDATQREVARVVRAYVAALNAHDGRRACALFVPSALSGVDFPHDRGGCAASLSASIGYRDPRGFPVYERSRVARIPSVAINGADARVTATVVTRFAGGREPSIEDDLVYLRMAGGRWLIVKPSATLYRAIGAGNIPPSVIAPP